jgi:hypothetical protein
VACAERQAPASGNKDAVTQDPSNRHDRRSTLHDRDAASDPSLISRTAWGPAAREDRNLLQLLDGSQSRGFGDLEMGSHAVSPAD